MANYQPTSIPKSAFLALLPTKISQDYVLEVATNKQIRINDLRNPVNAVTLQKNIKKGIYREIETAYPRSLLIENDNWSIQGIDVAARTALIRLDSSKETVYLSCDLLVPNEPCRSLFCMQS